MLEADISLMPHLSSLHDLAGFGGVTVQCELRLLSPPWAVSDPVVDKAPPVEEPEQDQSTLKDAISCCWCFCKSVPWYTMAVVFLYLVRKVYSVVRQAISVWLLGVQRRGWVAQDSTQRQLRRTQRNVSPPRSPTQPQQPTTLTLGVQCK